MLQPWTCPVMDMSLSKLQWLVMNRETWHVAVHGGHKELDTTERQNWTNAPTTNAENWSWMVLWRPMWPSRTNTKKRWPFHYMRLECKSRKSRDTWSNRQIWSWSTKWCSPKVNRVLPREHTGHSQHPLPTTQEKTLHMDMTRWSIPKSDWLYSLQPKMEKLYTVNKNKTGSWLWLRSWTPYYQVQTQIEENRENH